MYDLKQLSASFAADGFVTLDRLWSPAEVQEVETELERFLVECVPRMEKVHKTFTEGWQGEVKSLGGLDLYDGYFKELGNHPLMRQLASSLLGDEALFVAIEFFSRPPGSDAIGPYHQDNGYFCYQPAEALAFWIALDDVDAQNGGVVYARGSTGGACCRTRRREFTASRNRWRRLGNSCKDMRKSSGCCRAVVAPYITA